MAEAVFDRGGLPVELPLIAIAPPEERDRRRLVSALQKLAASHYQGFLVTSVNTVHQLDPLWEQASVEPANITTPVFAVGVKTAAALQQRGLACHTGEGTAESVLTLVKQHLPELSQLRFLFPRADEGRETLVRGLTAAGAHVDRINAYRTVPLFDGPHLPPTIRVDWVTFTSPSAAEVFAVRTDLAPWTRVACIGPTTAHAAQQLGFEVSVVSPEQTVEAMLDAMIQAGPPQYVHSD